MTENTAIWDALAKTDPSHTKGFNRAGGFKGTAIKPIWIVKRLTEQFGPCGKGWGIDQPKFEVVSAGEETLVYCTVRCWYDDGDPLENRFVHGVGGDKVVTKRNDGKLFHDDEAFKKAFTDAVGNAFKFIGVGADVHMGLFDDDKYVSQAREDFRDPPPTVSVIDDAQFAEIVTLADAAGVPVARILETAKVPTLKDLPAADFEAVRKKLNLTIDQNTARKEAA